VPVAVAVLAAVLAVVLAGCFDGDEDSTTKATTTQTRLSPEARPAEVARAADLVVQAGNAWAPLFAKDVWAACHYTYGRQAPSCSEFSLGSRGGPHDRPSAFQRSFADATVESVAVKGDKAWAEFSNGELGEFIRVAKTELPIDSENAIQKIPPGWYIYRVGGNAGKKYFEP
jgi:hypothetical protein